jgi:hypothetical protein
MKTTILLLISATLVGCSTTHVKQSNELSVDYFRPDGTLERRETRKLDSDVSAVGDGNANVSKLRGSQSKSGTLSLGTEGAEGEVTSPALAELVKSLSMLIEISKSLAK